MKPRCAIRDRYLVLAVFIAAAVIGAWYLFGHVGLVGLDHGFAPSWFEASVMVAFGEGFTVADPGQLPALEEFLAQKRMTLSRDAVPSDLDAQPATFQFYLCHRYLLTLVGFIWWLFGVSWTTFKIPIVVLYAVTASVAYGLCRQAMRRSLALVCSALYILSPAVLAMTPSIRDFGKAPFILGALLVMGILLKHRFRTPAYLGLSLLLGMVLGVGLGFRQDALICIPPALVVIAVGARGVRPIRLWVRGAAVVLCGAAFYATAFPIIAGMKLDSGSVSSHTLVQGFSSEALSALGVDDASYELISSVNDNLVHATVNSYERRMGRMEPMDWYHCPEYGRAGKRFALDVVTAFPADLVARSWAAIPAVLNSVAVLSDENAGGLGSDNAFVRAAARWERPLLHHLRACVLLYGVFALTVLGFRSLRGLVAVLLLCGYMFGYTSLLFQERHCFHFALAAFLIVGFLIEQALHVVGVVVARERRSELLHFLRSSHGTLSWKALTVLAFWVVLGAAIVAPLAGARWYQERQVEHMAAAYGQLGMQPLEIVSGSDEDWVTLHLMGDLPPFFRACDRLTWGGIAKRWLAPTHPVLAARVVDRTWEVPTEYCVAEFVAEGGSFPMRIDYETGNSANDFSEVVAVEAGAGAGRVRYFFPVYEAAAPPAFMPLVSTLVGDSPPWVRARFRGLTVPKEHAARFVGLYRVIDIEKCPFIPFLCVPADVSGIRGYKTLRQEGVLHNAFIAARYALNRNADQAIEACVEAVKRYPQCPQLLGTLDRILLEKGDPERRVEVWREMAGFLSADDPSVVAFYAAALNAAGMADGGGDVMKRFVPPRRPSAPAA